MLSETALLEFKKIYAEEFGEELSDEKATELGLNLLSLFNCIYRPIKKDWAEKISESKNIKKINN